MYLDDSKKFIMAENDEGDEVCICEAVCVVKTVTDLLTRKQMVVLRIYNKYHDVFSTVEMGREKLSRNIAATLCEYGVSISAEVSENIEHLLDFLFSTEQEAEHVFKHSVLGFTKVNGTMCFLAHKPIGLDRAFHRAMSTANLQDDASKWCAAMLNSESSCPEKTKPRGSFRAWRKIICQEVIGRPKLELAVAFGALAPIAHMLREAGVIVDLPMVALAGISSTGKTTVFRIIASMYGLATVGSGLITNMNSTVNGLYAQLAANYGYPALFDEVTGTIGMDMSSVIYYMPNGRDKVRCNSDGSLKTPIQYSGAIFFSSEKSLFESTINTDGLHARLAEFPFVWTASRQNAENLEQGLSANCGTAVYPLMQWLLKREDWLIQSYKAEHNRLCGEYKKLNPRASNVANRVLNIYAQIMVAAQAVSIALNLPLAIPEMRKLLLRTLKQNPVAEANPEDEYELMKSFVMDKLKNFPDRKAHPSTLTSVWGFTKMTHGKKEAWIQKDIFEKQLTIISDRDRKIIIKDFVANRWLYQDSSRHKLFTEKIAGVSTKFYRLFLEDTDQIRISKAKSNMNKSPQLKSLLAG